MPCFSPDPRLHANGSQRTGDKPRSSAVWHALPVCATYAAAIRCTSFPTDGLP